METKFILPKRRNETVLTDEDVKNICMHSKNNVPYSIIQRKYKIGGDRLTKILRANNCESSKSYKTKKQNKKQECISDILKNKSNDLKSIKELAIKMRSTD